MWLQKRLHHDHLRIRDPHPQTTPKLQASEKSKTIPYASAKIAHWHSHTANFDLDATTCGTSSPSKLDSESIAAIGACFSLATWRELMT